MSERSSFDATLSILHDHTLTDAARRVIDVLEAAGHEAWFVGGCVRDALLGTIPHDFDITCSAHWSNTAEALRLSGIAVHETGIAHGTVTAVVMGQPIEVTTYRTEGTYSDHRHPDRVQFVSDIREDLARRDFTINAMAWHPTRGLLDPFGGAQDLQAGFIRAVGDPDTRFSEDALRLLRALRFSCRYDFALEKKTAAALVRHIPELEHIARERIGAELDIIVRSGHAARALRTQPELMCAVIPELAPCRGFDQRSIYHAFDVLEHTERVIEGVEEFSGGEVSGALAWAALLHDVAKPACFTLDPQGQGHFFGHPICGAGMARKILRRLSVPTTVIGECRALIRFHDCPVLPDATSVRHMLYQLEKACPGRASALAFELLCLKRADACAKTARCRDYVEEIDRIEAVLRRELDRQSAWQIRNLAIGGGDLIELGFAQDARLGRLLEEALELVMAGALANTHEELVMWAKHKRP
ncbi:MAG: HD domain-containing protein [Atopobiaceae bacterium]|nr:HD domain-containing protein [Atopobiaceae bacterium]